MQKTWLVQKSFITCSAREAIYLFFLFLLQQTAIFSPPHNLFKFNLIDKFITLTIFKNVIKAVSTNFSLRFHKHSFKITTPSKLFNFRDSKRKKFKLAVNFLPSCKWFTTSNTINFYILNIYFLTSNSPVYAQLALHHNFNFFGAYRTSSKIIVVNSKNFFKKWRNAFILLSNTSYYNDQPLVFASSVLKKEALSINWNYNHFLHDLWNLATPFFVSKITVHTKKVAYFFKKLNNVGLNYVLVTDSEQHFKLLPYFLKLKWYSIALIPININPWSVSFAIPILQNTFTIQLFFINFLIFANKTALYHKYLFYNKLWIKFLLNNKTFKNIV